MDKGAESKHLSFPSTLPTDPREGVTWLFGVDRAYRLSLAALLRSLCASESFDPNDEIVVLHQGLNELEQTKLNKLVKPFSVVFHAADTSGLGFLPTFGHLSSATYYRLMFNQIFEPRYPRLIYLDSDMLSVSDLAELRSLDLRGNCVAAVVDPELPKLGMALPAYRDLGLDPHGAYFNAGVLVIDVELWRTLEVADRSLRLLQDHYSVYRYGDQDALNTVMGGSFTIIPQRFNLLPKARISPHLCLAFADEDEIEGIRQDPALIHYAGPIKPWHIDSSDPDAGLWVSTARQCPFRGASDLYVS